LQTYVGMSSQQTVSKRFEPNFIKAGTLDREKVCPLLLRVFYKLGGHHRSEDFNRRGREPEEEVQIYTWRDATLRELADLLKEVHQAARQKTSVLVFAFVYPDKIGKMVLKEVGTVHAFPRKGQEKDEEKTLDELHFETGDFLDVAIYV